MEIALFSWFVVVFLGFNQASSECPLYYFTCKDGSCLHHTRVCNRNSDCDDGTDEHFCNPHNCHPQEDFLCFNWNCVSSERYCDGSYHCSDRSDERYCNIHSSDPCPPGWYRCPNGKSCIPFIWMCNGRQDCRDISEEIHCVDGVFYSRVPPPNAVLSPMNTVLKTSAYTDPEANMRSWFMGTNPDYRRDQWGSQVHRIAVALHLADESTFSPGNSTGEEIRYELTVKLHRIGKDMKISSQELALYIHALLVACMDPRDFYGEDLVKELRRRVETSGNYTNPLLILVLCNAGDTMTTRDVDRVTAAYETQYRPFWTDYEAMACMAMACISSRSDVSIDKSVLNEMLKELKGRQFKNGTIDNFRTTALVTQALFIHDSYKTDFDLDSAVKVLNEHMNGSHSLLDSYYALPVLNKKSLLDVTSDHCRKERNAKEKISQETPDVDREMIIVFFSVLMGEESNGARTWRLRMHLNSTIYDGIETLVRMDNSQKVEYNVVDGKPYVRLWNGKEDDPEMGMFWFFYLKPLNSDEDPIIVEESPVDVKLQPNQEILLWYKRAPWSSQSQMQKSETSS